MTEAAEQARALEAFAAAGAERVDPPILQPAETLLALYGEDIRGRAYTARDPLAGELMLRPDFTVPVVQLHLGRPEAPARYAYAGPVFRVQEIDTNRPSEYTQVGFESFGAPDPAQEDAAVFGLFAQILHGLPVQIVTGDIGLLIRAVQGLSTSERRKAALMRHLWRPNRFLRMLRAFTGSAQPPHHAALTAKAAQGTDILAPGVPLIGLRGEAEIWERVAECAEDAREVPIPAEEAALFDALLRLKAPLPQALTALQDMADRFPALRPAVDRFAARVAALAEVGADPSALTFEGSYGLTSMEYYDGFVFGVSAGGGVLPPVVLGGRYDALTRAMGREVPAVGGVMRPALLAGLRS